MDSSRHCEEFPIAEKLESEMSLSLSTEEVDTYHRPKSIADDCYWECSACTHRNRAEELKCSICDVKKGTSKRSLSLSTEEMDTNHRPKRQAKPTADGGYWLCSACTYINSTEAFKCSMCDVKNGAFKRSLPLSTEEMDTYHRYVKDGKDAARQGNMSKSLELFNRAHNIHPNETLQNLIKKVQEAVQVTAQKGSESEEDELIDVNNSGLLLFKELYDKLYDHQKEGVTFLYRLYKNGRKGGILADDMGLGKTIQVISFLSGMYDAGQVKHSLLIMPTSLIKNWTKEFAKWTPGMRVKEFHGAQTERNRNLENVQRDGGVIITTYQMLIKNWELLASHNGQEFKWDYVILDEAHKIKNPSAKTAKLVYAVPARNRVLLTGTPVQNNLREMWSLFTFACHGSLLGTYRTFKTEYENPITRAREKDATPGEKALGLKMSENLMAIIKPYFLRRTKAEVQSRKQNTAAASQNDLESDDKENKGAIMPNLTKKNDLIIWTYLSKIQEDIYNRFISLDHIKELLMTTKSPLAELTILKKLCDHPRLLSARAVAQLGLEEGTSANRQDKENECAANRIDNIADETLIYESGKLVFLVALLERLREEGHRTLVFSQSRKMLDIIERVLVNKHFKVMRVDGTIRNLTEREHRISLFQNDEQYSVFLLTTQVGGVGLTLTAADRVVIFDPSWNPATDAQAVDRAYRIGQTENVVIYRLITCGTVEEKIYRRQVFKDSLIRQTTGDKKNPFRYFSRQDLRELFTLQDTRSSSTQLQLQSLHPRQKCTDLKLDEHIAHLHTMEMFGISDHDLMFSREVGQHEDAPEDQESHHYIENRVQKAQELMKAESELNKQIVDDIQSNTELFDFETGLWKPAQQKTMGSTKRKPKNARPSPSFPNNAFEPVDLTQSGSADENDIQNLSDEVIDLTVKNEDEKLALQTQREEKLLKIDLISPIVQSLEEVVTDGDIGAFDEVMDTSSPSKKNDVIAMEHNYASLPVCATDMFPEEEPDLQEGNSEFQVHIDGHFSGDEKTAAILQWSMYDDSEEDEEMPQFLTWNRMESSKSLGSSKPKSIKSTSTSFKPLERFRGNTSVASKHSLVKSVIEDLDNLDSPTPQSP